MLVDAATAALTTTLLPAGSLGAGGAVQVCWAYARLGAYARDLVGGG